MRVLLYRASQERVILGAASCAMNRGQIEEHLMMAERHVAQGERHIARQIELIAELARASRDTVEARSLLVNFDASQAFHVQYRDRLIRELTEGYGWAVANVRGTHRVPPESGVGQKPKV